MRTSQLALVAALFVACAQAGVPGSSGVGRFVFAGPVGNADRNFTVSWRYGFAFDVDPSTVSQVSFSCGAIPGSTFVVKRGELKLNAQRVGFWEGPKLPVTREGVPWLFDSGTTHEVCQAVVSRNGTSDAVERAPVTFDGSNKRATLAQLSMAHDYNSKLPPKK
jgi:hypothetical protein